jgi:cysteinyl-tRNA synthetase
VDFNPEKRNLADFALWKFSPQDHTRDMEWDSPWGVGFPGWHIECSAMSMKYLGQTLDIHAGGIDHVPVHHTNEIAQSEAATGKPFARTWMHSNHITIEGEKISKSLGNGITLEDIEARSISLEAFRLHVLESHYRSQSKFSWDSLEAAQNRLRAYRAMAVRRWQIAGEGGITQAVLQATQQAIAAALTNDLDTPAALASLSQLEAAIDTSGISADSQVAFADFLGWLDDALGLGLSQQADITAEERQLIVERSQARQAQDWAKSDQLRDQLTEAGLAVRDTAAGAIWHRL